MATKTPSDLHRFVTWMLLAAGADRRNAGIVAGHMVSAHLSGVDTHGVWHLPHYISAIQAGELVPDAWPSTLQQTPMSARVTGNWTFGQVAAKYAMELVLKLAEDQGMAVVTLVQAHHIGRLGEYAEMAAAKQMIGMVWTSGHAKEDPRTAPYGGRGKILATCPLSIGFPAGEEEPMIVDYATTAASGTKVRMAAARDESVPPNWVIDKDGNPTTNPKDFLAGGAFLPFGGHKGYALMMAVEFLGRVFSGADAFADPDRGGVVYRHAGATMLAMRPDLFQPFEEYADQADDMIRRTRAVQPAPGFREVLVPGDPERKARTERLRDGIPLPEDQWNRLTELAKSLGVTGL